MSVNRLNVASMEFTGNLVLPRNSNRSCFILQVRQGIVFIEFGGTNGYLKLEEGEKFVPEVIPTSRIRIIGGTFVIISDTLPVSELSNKVIDMASYVPEVEFVDFTSQSTTGLDVIQNIKYGSAKTSPNNYISIANDGVISIIKTGYFMFKTRHRWSRTGSSGTSRITQWVEISLDGVNWIKTGQPVDTALLSAEDTKHFTDAAAIFLQAGTKIRARWARSSANSGANSGELTAQAPSATLATANVGTVASAQLTVYVPDPQG